MQITIYIPDKDKTQWEKLKADCRDRGISISAHLWGLAKPGPGLGDPFSEKRKEVI